MKSSNHLGNPPDLIGCKPPKSAIQPPSDRTRPIPTISAPHIDRPLPRGTPPCLDRRRESGIAVVHFFSPVSRRTMTSEGVIANHRNPAGNASPGGVGSRPAQSTAGYRWRSLPQRHPADKGWNCIHLCRREHPESAAIGLDPSPRLALTVRYRYHCAAPRQGRPPFAEPTIRPVAASQQKN